MLNCFSRSLSKTKLSKMPLVLHGMELSAPCRSAMAVAKQIGVDLKVQEVDLFTGANKTEEYMKMNPNHTIPTLDDNGFYLWESRAILTYLVQKYGKDDKLYPKDIQKRALVDNMLYFDIGSLYDSFAKYFYPQAFAGEAANPEKEEGVKDRLTTLEKILTKSPYVAGDHLTVADISIVTSLTVPKAFNYSFCAYPHIIDYIAKVRKEVPAFDGVCKAGEEKLAGFIQSKITK